MVQRANRIIVPSKFSRGAGREVDAGRSRAHPCRPSRRPARVPRARRSADAAAHGRARHPSIRTPRSSATSSCARTSTRLLKAFEQVRTVHPGGAARAHREPERRLGRDLRAPRGAARLRRGPRRRATCRTRRSRRSSVVRACSSIRPCTKGSASRRSRRWRPGTPVVAAKTSSLPEALGEHARWVAPGRHRRDRVRDRRSLRRRARPVGDRSGAAVGGRLHVGGVGCVDARGVRRSDRRGREDLMAADADARLSDRAARRDDRGAAAAGRPRRHRDVRPRDAAPAARRRASSSSRSSPRIGRRVVDSPGSHTRGGLAIPRTLLYRRWTGGHGPSVGGRSVARPRAEPGVPAA